MTALEQIKARIFPVIVRVPLQLWEDGFLEMYVDHRYASMDLGEPNYVLGFSLICLESDKDKIAMAEKYPSMAGIRGAAAS